MPGWQGLCALDMPGVSRREQEGSQDHSKRRAASAFSNFSIWYFSAILGPVSMFSGLLPFLRILLPKLSTLIAVGFSMAPGLHPTYPHPHSQAGHVHLPTL